MCCPFEIVHPPGYTKIPSIKPLCHLTSNLTSSLALFFLTSLATYSTAFYSIHLQPHIRRVIDTTLDWVTFKHKCEKGLLYTSLSALNVGMNPPSKQANVACILENYCILGQFPKKGMCHKRDWPAISAITSMEVSCMWSCPNACCLGRLLSVCGKIYNPCNRLWNSHPIFLQIT